MASGCGDDAMLQSCLRERLKKLHAGVIERREGRRHTLISFSHVHCLDGARTAVQQSGK